MKILVMVLSGIVQLILILASIIWLCFAPYYEIGIDLRPFCIFIIVVIGINWIFYCIEDILKKYFGKEPRDE